MSWNPDWRHIRTDAAAKNYNQLWVLLKWKLTCRGPDWYAERYAGVLNAAAEERNFRAVKRLMKSDFYADDCFQLLGNWGKG